MAEKTHTREFRISVGGAVFFIVLNMVVFFFASRRLEPSAVKATQKPNNAIMWGDH